MTRFLPLVLVGLALLSLGGMARSAAVADEPTRQGPWTIQHDPQSDGPVLSMELTLHPQAEPRPALRYRLLPDDFDMVDGNAALYYLKAMGFLEQNSARDQLSEVLREAGQRAQTEGKEYSEVPPYSWQAMTPAELPVEEVKKYLQLTSFQERYLREAAKRRTMSLDRQIRDAQDPIAYLLPEIQTMRELARTQSLRCKVAIAEGRVDDALEILGQQYAMARHLSQDEFFVSNLVGIACASIAGEDALQFVQLPQAPNLYWAYAAFPPAMFESPEANAFERQFLYEQIKVLREVNETPQTVGYWQDFIDRVVAQTGSLAGEFGLPPEVAKDPVASRAMVAGFIAAAYPGAKRFLIEQCGMAPAQVEAYPTAQTVFLAVVRYYDQARDDIFKWNLLPFWQVTSSPVAQRRDEEMRASAERVGWSAFPTQLVLPAITSVRHATARGRQLVALIQTVEAIRMYGAAHAAQLPPALADLPVPAPMDPFTGKPLAYEFHGDHAELLGHPMPGLQYRLVLRFAAGAQQ